MGDVGFGALAPDNDGSQEKADESADEKSDNEGNHLSILYSSRFRGAKKQTPAFTQWNFPGPLQQWKQRPSIKHRLL
jgi:hypothetical protein